ncbi:MAG: hypothetical protein ACFCU2_13010 [Acidimicrobiia bacterium]
MSAATLAPVIDHLARLIDDVGVFEHHLSSTPVVDRGPLHQPAERTSRRSSRLSRPCFGTMTRISKAAG